MRLLDWRSVLHDAVDELHPHDVYTSRTCGWLGIIDSGSAQEVLEMNLQAITHVHAEGDRTGSFAIPKSSIAGRGSPAIESDNVLEQCEDHSLRLGHAQAVPEERLVQGDYISLVPPGAAGTRGERGCWGWHRQRCCPP